MPDLVNNAGRMKYEFTSTPFRYQEEAACSWNFISLPKELAKEIRGNHKHQEEGWGRLKVTAQIGNSEWKTSIWFDTKHDTYLLPLKAEIRKKEKIDTDVPIKAAVWI